MHTNEYAVTTARYHGSPMDRSADVALADRLMARDESALNDAISTYGKLVFGIARRVVAEPSLAEEVAQDTFLALWRRPGAYDPERGGLQAFLAGVARNKAIDLVRREEALRRAKDSLIREAEATSATLSTNESQVEVEDREDVRIALGQVSELQREAIVLAYFGGRTYREVAAELDIPEGTAKTRLRDGLMKLREIMESRRGS